jgi:hypothetical protein
MQKKMLDSTPLLVRGGKLIPWLIKPDGDFTWSDSDWARAKALEARWKMHGINEATRRQLIPCAIWSSKFPGLVFHDDIQKQLEELSAEKNEIVKGDV